MQKRFISKSLTSFKYIRKPSLLVRGFSATQGQQAETEQPFQEQSGNSEQSQSTLSDPPPVFDYQAPKDDSYQNFQSTKDFIRRYFILFPLAAYCFYELCFISKNRISKNREYKLFGGLFHSSVLGPLISQRISKAYEGKFYKQDTEEVKLVRNIIDKVVLSNNLIQHVSPYYQVKVIHNENIGMFMNVDNKLYVSVNVLKIAEMKEEQVALLICHELAHYILDHQIQRLLNSLGHYMLKDLGLFKLKSDIKFRDPTLDEFKKRTQVQHYLCFYPHQRVMSKFYERNCDTLAIQLWKKAYPDCDHLSIVEQVYDRINQEIQKNPQLKEKEQFQPDYKYNRLEINRKLVNAKVEAQVVPA
ncbi:m48 family [Stylonychia lemnae]|uniref:M48 family n=1 Tax=Stylonychia lemnae TaxID=5949 RepID=A0A078AF66_STYLE|nr:m48 family [Stylonychia lemnae]|eukprot:CDW80167.1 m48 family [Stylonychia lemnae]